MLNFEIDIQFFKHNNKLFFSELNSYGNRGETSRPHNNNDYLNVRRHLDLEEAELGQNPLPLPTQRPQRQRLQEATPIHNNPEPVIIEFQQQYIKVPRAMINNIITPIGCEPLFGRNIIPNYDYRRENHYATFAVVEFNIKCVVFVNELGRMFAAKLPPGPDDRFHIGK